jgi:hypothetical protein
LLGRVLGRLVGRCNLYCVILRIILPDGRNICGDLTVLQLRVSVSGKRTGHLGA